MFEPEGVDGRDPEQYSFVDPRFTDKSFFEVSDEVPWGNDQPKNGPDADCVEWDIKCPNQIMNEKTRSATLRKVFSVDASVSLRIVLFMKLGGTKQH